MLMRHAAYYLLKNPDTFQEYALWYLEDNNESWESYCMNIYYGNIWADDLVAAAIGKLFNVSVTIVSPAFEKPLNLFHDESDPDVVLVINGGGVNTPYISTHFSATRRKQPRKLPGDNLDSYDVKVYESAEHAKTMARTWRLNMEKRFAIKRLGSVNTRLGDLEKHIREEQEKVVFLKTMRDKLEQDLISLGVDIEKVAALRLEGDPLPRDQNVEKMDTQPDNVAEPEIPQTENITGSQNVVQGVSAGASKMLTTLLSPESLKYLPDNKSLIITESDKGLTLSTGPLIDLESMNTQEMSTDTLPAMPSASAASASALNVPIPPGAGLMNIAMQPSQATSTGMMNIPGQPLQVSGGATLAQQSVSQDFPGQPLEASGGVPLGQQSMSQVLPGSSTVPFYVTDTASGIIECPKRGPVPPALRKPGKFYCPKCGKEYSHRSTANKHVATCGTVKSKDYKCDQCGSDYDIPRGLLEHTAAQHTKEYLYFCKNDGCPRKTEGFFYMSRASEHKANCLYKNVPDEAEDKSADQ